VNDPSLTGNELNELTTKQLWELTKPDHFKTPLVQVVTNHGHCPKFFIRVDFLLLAQATQNYSSRDHILQQLEKYGGICDCQSSR